MVHFNHNDRAQALHYRLQRNAGQRLTQAQLALVERGYTIEAARRKTRRDAELARAISKDYRDRCESRPQRRITTVHHCPGRYDSTDHEKYTEISEKRRRGDWTLADISEALGICETCIIAIIRKHTN